MTSGANVGFARTIPHMLGVALGFAFMVMLVGIGLVGIFNNYPMSHQILKYVSLAYLIYLAAKIAMSGRAKEVDDFKPLTFFAAASFQWVNPKGWSMALSAVTLFSSGGAWLELCIKAASHIILFAHNPQYKREDYARVINQDIANQRSTEEQREQAFGAYAFVDLNTDEAGNNAAWTKAQTYIALGNTLHTLARLSIDSTTMEGIDSELISDIFATELDGYVCDVALAIGYHDKEQDYNQPLPKSRLSTEQVLQVL